MRFERQVKLSVKQGNFYKELFIKKVFSERLLGKFICEISIPFVYSL